MRSTLPLVTHFTLNDPFYPAPPSLDCLCPISLPLPGLTPARCRSMAAIFTCAATERFKCGIGVSVAASGPYSQIWGKDGAYSPSTKRSFWAPWTVKSFTLSTSAKHPFRPSIASSWPTRMRITTTRPPGAGCGWGDGEERGGLECFKA